MKLKNVLIVTNDMERAISFYHELFGLDVILDNDGNVIMTEGLVLQDASVWKNFLKQEQPAGGDSSEVAELLKKVASDPKMLELLKTLAGTMK